MHKLQYTEFVRGITLSGTINRSTIDLKNKENGKRQKISKFTSDSAKRLSWMYMQYEWKSMLTLTYHNDFPDWKKCKKQLNSFLNHLRLIKVKYIWVVEFQRRGFPHFHIWMDRVWNDCPVWEDDFQTTISWRPIMKHWLRASGQLNDKKAYDFAMHQRTYTHWKINAKINYARKYASKNQQKGLPAGIDFFGRWWGCSSGLKLETDGYVVNDDDCSDEGIKETKNYLRFRRNVLKCLEHWFNFKLPKKLKYCMPIKFYLDESKVRQINRLLNYYVSLCKEELPF
jgi:hypothetical protein